MFLKKRWATQLEGLKGIFIHKKLSKTQLLQTQNKAFEIHDSDFMENYFLFIILSVLKLILKNNSENYLIFFYSKQKFIFHSYFNTL